MNRLPKDKQIQVITALTEGCSIRSIERMYDVHRDTITRLMVRTGQHCMSLMDDLMRDIPTGVYQCDEVWCFVRKKDNLFISRSGKISVNWPSPTIYRGSSGIHQDTLESF